MACQGAIGYGERYGAVYADGFTDIMIGGVILPSLLHQNPRYFCLGTGTKSSRRFRTLSSSFCLQRGQRKVAAELFDRGRRSCRGCLSNTFDPPSNRGVGLFLGISSSTPASERPPTWRRKSSGFG